jgi:hypothetical protein
MSANLQENKGTLMPAPMDLAQLYTQVLQQLGENVSLTHMIAERLMKSEEENRREREAMEARIAKWQEKFDEIPQERRTAAVLQYHRDSNAAAAANLLHNTPYQQDMVQQLNSRPAGEFDWPFGHAQSFSTNGLNYFIMVPGKNTNVPAEVIVMAEQAIFTAREGAAHHSAAVVNKKDQNKANGLYSYQELGQAQKKIAKQFGTRIG